ncbi:hypothetical protein E2C01_081396 [Portunus trituberculatus]|uniref:Uncharacterized protein n=1 Tax=Portunus trituberculatus TaxID=210409 RepID=A0A5B7J276_PORTR|nr:hypothetical protein [Portunus trituberculatus]
MLHHFPLNHPLSSSQMLTLYQSFENFFYLEKRSLIFFFLNLICVTGINTTLGILAKDDRSSEQPKPC